MHSLIVIVAFLLMVAAFCGLVSFIAWAATRALNKVTDNISDFMAYQKAMAVIQGRDA